MDRVLGGITDDENTPNDHRYPSRASGDRVRDRRRSIRTPIRAKLRPTRSARRAHRSYLTAVTFRHNFPGVFVPVEMAGPVSVATVLGCDPVSHRSCAVVVRGQSRIRYENTGEKYSPIII